jgi:hypothetical protein
MALKRDTFFFDFAPVRQRIHLKSPTIGQYRGLPTVELVQAACFLQNFQSGTQVKVVGISQTNLCANVVAEFVLVDGFYRRCCADGHKNRRFYGAVFRREQPDAGAGARVSVLEREIHLLGKNGARYTIGPFNV